MTKSTTTERGRKRLFAWVPEELHRRAKASAASDGIDLQDYIRVAIEEKLQRDEEERIARDRRTSFEVTR